MVGNFFVGRSRLIERFEGSDDVQPAMESRLSPSSSTAIQGGEPEQAAFQSMQKPFF